MVTVRLGNEKHLTASTACGSKNTIKKEQKQNTTHTSTSREPRVSLLPIPSQSNKKKKE